jgi:plastocyanin
MVTAALASLGCFVLAACSSGAAEKPSSAAAEKPPAAPAATSDPSGTDVPGNEVTMRLIAYRPEVLRVRPGTQVTWRQQDAGFHTVTSGVVEQQPGGVMARPDGRFDSGQIPEGQTYSVSLDQPGTYPYFCAIHPSTMRGQLEVS